jgi:hypothetical protein
MAELTDPYFTPTGPTSSGIGPITDQEIQMMNQLSSSRQGERQERLQQRAYQSYINALNRLRAAEAAGNPNAMQMSGAADAQNRLNAIRQPMGSGSVTDDEMRTYEVDGKPVQMTQEEMMRAVQSGQITPGQAASMLTGIAAPMGPVTDKELGALSNLPSGAGAGSTSDTGALRTFFQNLFLKGSQQ